MQSGYPAFWGTCTMMSSFSKTQPRDSVNEASLDTAMALQNMCPKHATLPVEQNTNHANLVTENFLEESKVHRSGLQKFRKRKRLNGDLCYGRDHIDLEVEGGSSLSLGLGFFSSCSEGNYGCKEFSAKFVVGKENGLLIDLSLGLTLSGSNNEPIRDCTTSAKIISGGNFSALTSTESESAICGKTSNKLHRESDMLLELGCMQSESRESYHGDIHTECPEVLAVDSGKDAYGMHLQLGLPAVAAMKHSACVSNVPSCTRLTRDLHEKRLDTSGLEHIPVMDEGSASASGLEKIPIVDEGSTSARCKKVGGYIPSLLMGDRLEGINDGNISVIYGTSVFSGPKEVILSNQARAELPIFPVSTRVSGDTKTTSGASGSRLHRISKTCKFPGCEKGARGASGLCIAHGGGHRCQRQGCNKGAEGHTVYCKAHGGGRRCQSLGCTKSSEGKTEFCIAHGGGRRCTHNGCCKAARGRSGLCIRHGGGKRCQEEGCTKSAEGFSGLCISHGGGKRCQFVGCGKGAQGSTLFCKAHGGGKRCMIEGCTKGAEGSTPLCKAHGGGKRCMFGGGGICSKSVHGGTPFCVAHGGGKRCAVQGCTKSARGRTDCCVRHGGGKRCNFEACSKSAQGSTDFCKAHGGGKKCSWGQQGSTYNAEYLKENTGEPFKEPCGRFARGKLGLCAAHSALVQDLREHGGGSLVSALSKEIGQPFWRVPSEGAEDRQHLERSFTVAKTGRANDWKLGDEGTQALDLNTWSNGHGVSREAQGIAFSSILKYQSSDLLMNPTTSNALELAEVTPPVDKINLDSSLRPVGSWPDLSHSFICSNICFNSVMMDATYMKNSLSILSGLQLTADAGITDTKPGTLSLYEGNLDASLTKQQTACTIPESANGLFGALPLSLSEERVHGGGLMALLAGGATGSRGIMQKDFETGI